MMVAFGVVRCLDSTCVRKSEISATDGGNRRFLLRMGEIGDFCYGWGKSEISATDVRKSEISATNVMKSEISATDGGNRRFLLRMGEIGDFCYR